MQLITLLNSFTVLAGSAFAAYTLQDDYFDGSFFDKFEFWDLDDPTHGFVKYGDRNTSQHLGLLNSTQDNVRMFVDSNNVTPKGRPSVRITSRNVYNHALIVLDLDHMPGGICGTWPAFWTLGPAWPSHGEMDIIEGVHDQPGNKMTLHAGPLCKTMTNFGGTGKPTLTECLSGDGTDSSGCQIATNDTITYGSGFNANGGGVYATEWLADEISIWFFPRGHCPPNALGDSPDPSTWGPPLAKFESGDECDMSAAFKDQQIIFDTTFCGDWAGQPTIWGNNTVCSKKAHTCEDFVRENPHAFADAYWSVNVLKVYTDDSQQSDGPSSTNTLYDTLPTEAPAGSSIALSVGVGVNQYAATTSVGGEAEAAAPTNAPEEAQEGKSSEGGKGAASFAKRDEERQRLAKHLGMHQRRAGGRL